MPDYRRSQVPGGTYFFTVNLLERFPNDLLVSNIDILRAAVKKVKKKYPFQIDGWVVLPDHIHCIWTLPPDDNNYSTRWRLIKTYFVRKLPKTERRSFVRQKRGERGIWQRRYWEHQIRDDKDYSVHMDYLLYNPVKHGYVQRVTDWPFSTFSHLVKKGIYAADGGGAVELGLSVGEAS